MKKPIIWSLLIEGVIILISIFAIISRGGHSGMMVFLLLHIPSSVLAIFLGELARQAFSFELIGGILTVVVSAVLQMFLFVVILSGFSALAKHFKSI